MLKTIFTILLLLCFSRAITQPDAPRYNLGIGDTYYITQELMQETETDNSELINSNASLDINCTVEFETTSISSDGDYIFSCRYRDLSLSFFSPRSDHFISSQNKAFSNIKTYLKELEKQQFGITISAFGELRETGPLDSIINSLFIEDKPDKVQHDLIIKTLREAFGENALKSLVNIVINIYGDTVADSSTKTATISLNAQSLPIKNRFYYMPVNDNRMRVQGVGVIEETKGIIEHENRSILTTMHGQQTYDHLLSRASGWIIKGISKQRIYSLSTIKGHSEFPDGLKIPSVTESEYIIHGGKLATND